MENVYSEDSKYISDEAFFEQRPVNHPLTECERPSLLLSENRNGVESQRPDQTIGPRIIE